MRIAKLSRKEFTDENALEAFFEGLPNRNPPGLFLVKKQIRSDGLAENETILFTYAGRLRYVARAATGRLDNTFEPRPDFPYCFVINPTSIRRTDLAVDELQQRFDAAGIGQRLGGRGWTVIDNDAAERIVEVLAADAHNA